MTTPKRKNPYEGDITIGPSDRYSSWNEGYAAGLRDGEKRLARALRRLLRNDRYFKTPPTHVQESVLDWLNARAKRRKKDLQ